MGYLTSYQPPVPAHNPLKVGTLNAILRDVAEHFDLTRNQLLDRLF